MSSEEIIRLIGYIFAGGLFGGLIVGVLNIYYSYRERQHQQEYNQLMDQLKFLYGHIYYFTHYNEQLFLLCRNIEGFYQKRFIDTHWSETPTTQTRITEEAQTTLELGNAYIDKVIDNNKNILQIMEVNWYLIDYDDINVFTEFMIDCIRYEKEVKDERRVQLPMEFHTALGPISFMRPALIVRVKEKVVKKQSRIDELRRPWCQKLGDFLKKQGFSLRT